MENDNTAENENQQTFEVQRKHHDFTMVENAVLFDPMCGKASRLVYVYLCYHADHKGDSCYPSTRTLAKETGIGRSTVIDAIRNLVKTGHVEKQTSKKPDGGYAHNIYTLTGKRLSEGGGGLVTDQGGLDSEPKQDSLNKTRTYAVIDSRKYGKIRYDNRDGFTDAQIQQAAQLLEDYKGKVKNPTGFIDRALREEWQVEHYNEPEIYHPLPDNEIKKQKEIGMEGFKKNYEKLKEIVQ